MYTIDSELIINNKGNIVLYNSTSINSKKSQIELYLSIEETEIPFSDFGNLINQYIYEELNSEIMEELKNELINEIENRFEIKIFGSEINIDRVTRTGKLIIYIDKNLKNTLEFIL